MSHSSSRRLVTVLLLLWPTFLIIYSSTCKICPIEFLAERKASALAPSSQSQYFSALVTKEVILFVHLILVHHHLAGHPEHFYAQARLLIQICNSNIPPIASGNIAVPCVSLLSVFLPQAQCGCKSKRQRSQIIAHNVREVPLHFSQSWHKMVSKDLGRHCIAK